MDWKGGNLDRRLFQLFKYASTYIPAPWIKEHFLRAELEQLQRTAGLFHRSTVDRWLGLAQTLIEQDRFDEAEQVLQTTLQGRGSSSTGAVPADDAHYRALGQLASIYRARYYRLFLADFLPGPEETEAEAVRATRVLESLIGLCQTYASTPSAACLDSLGRMLAWTGLHKDAQCAMALRMQLLRGRGGEAFARCDICELDMPPGVAYFCRLCENTNVCERCYDARRTPAATTTTTTTAAGVPEKSVRKSLSRGPCRNCFFHLIEVTDEPSAQPDNVAAQLQAWLPALLDAVHARGAALDGAVVSLPGATAGKALFSPEVLEEVLRLDGNASGDLSSSRMSAFHEVQKLAWREHTLQAILTEGWDGPSSLSNTTLLAMVHNTRSLLTQKYRDAFGEDVLDGWDAAHRLPAEVEDRFLDYDDGETLDRHSASLVEVAAHVIQLAHRPQPALSLVTASGLAGGGGEDGRAAQDAVAVPPVLYERLDVLAQPDTIRLVELLPGRHDDTDTDDEDDDDPIRCNLLMVRTTAAAADELPAYEALSYVWGSPRPEQLRAIEVSGQRAFVAPNLHSALRHLRRPTEARLLWIDALCIQQDSVAEKSAQVAQMAAIYRGASAVVAFLGEAQSENTGRFKDLSHADLFAFLNRGTPDKSHSYYKPEASWEDEDDEEDEDERRRFDEALQRLGLRKEPVLLAFFDLCSRAWWNRLWIVQEYAVASADPVLVLGAFHTTAGRLLRDMEMLASEHHRTFWLEEMRIRDYMHTPYYPVTQALGVAQVRPAAAAHRRRCEAWLYQLLLSSAHAWCADRRDVVYGRRLLLPPVLQRLFPPDYRLSTEQLYERLAVWLLVFERGVELFWDFPVRLSPLLPSWVPDFSQPRRHVSDADRRWQHPDSRKLYLDPYPAICRGVLALYGRPVDVVRHVFSLRVSAGDFKADRIGRLWFLDAGLAALDRQVPLWQRHPLAAKLPALYAPQPLQAWCTEAETRPGRMHTGSSANHTGGGTRRANWNSVSAFLLDRATVTRLQRLIADVLAPVRDKVREQTRLARILADALATVGNEATYYSNTCDDLVRLSAKLDALAPFVLDTATTHPDFLGAALFDPRRLADSLHQLRAPSSRGSTGQTARQRDISRAALQAVLDAVPEAPPPPPAAADFDHAAAAPAFPGLPLPSYGAIQHWVADETVFDEEVAVAARLLLRIAHKMRAYDDEEEDDDDDDDDYAYHGGAGIFRDTLSTLEPARGLDGLDDSREGGLGASRSRIMGRAGRRYRTRQSVFLSQGARLFDNRSFFVTATGLVGVASLGTEGLAVGDALLLLDAAPMPLVLRETKKSGPGLGAEAQHELVGYAHVRGLETSDVLDLPPVWWPELRLFKVV